MTYGEIAKKLGVPHESREVGQALGRNPIAIIVPHRVLGADGKMGGFSATGGAATKRRILRSRARGGGRRVIVRPAEVTMAAPGFAPAAAVAHLRHSTRRWGASSTSRLLRHGAPAARSVFAAPAEAIVYQQPPTRPPPPSSAACAGISRAARQA
jgi:O-6-methylguanine DNA methyltransferase